MLTGGRRRVAIAISALVWLAAGCSSGDDSSEALHEALARQPDVVVQRPFDLDTTVGGVDGVFSDRVTLCMEREGFDGPVPNVVIRQFASLDFESFLSVPHYRRGPVTGRYEPGPAVAADLETSSGRTPADGTSANPLAVLDEPAYEAALLGRPFLLNGGDPSFDPLVDAEGCLWTGLASSLTDALGLGSTDQLRSMEVLFELNETLWVEFDDRWSSCMAARGHRYLAVEDPYFEFVDVEGSPDEVAVAEDDVACRELVLADPEYTELWKRLDDEAARIGAVVQRG